MSIDHPISDQENFKEELSVRDISYTRHFEEERLPYRSNVTKDLIEEHLQEPDNLVDFRYEEDDHKREKYQVLFDKSSKYFLKIVLSMSKGEIFIVTAHVVNKAKKRRSQVLK